MSEPEARGPEEHESTTVVLSAAKDLMAGQRAHR
jgi:hypothetical protein